jgi:hypothetical protein
MTAQASSHLQLIPNADTAALKDPSSETPRWLASGNGAGYGGSESPPRVVPIDRNAITMEDDGPHPGDQPPRQMSKRLVEILLGIQRIAIYVAESQSREQEKLEAPYEIDSVRPGVESRAS